MKKHEKIYRAANDPWMNRSMMINLKIIIFIFISKSPDIFMLYCRKNHATHHVWYKNKSTHTRRLTYSFSQLTAGTQSIFLAIISRQKMSDIDISSLKFDTILILFGETIIDFNNVSWTLIESSILFQSFSWTKM